MQTLVIEFISKYSYFGILLLIALENIFPPIPSEIILTFSGFMAEKAELNLVLMIIFATLGSLIGAIVLYFLGYLLNTSIFNKIIDTKIGKLLHLKRDKIESSIEVFNKNGKYSVFFSRLVPIIRSLISIPAGIAKMNFSLFIILTTLGSLIWNSILILLGNMVGENFELVTNTISKYYKSFIIIFLVLFFLYKKVKGNKIITFK